MKQGVDWTARGNLSKSASLPLHLWNDRWDPLQFLLQISPVSRDLKQLGTPRSCPTFFPQRRAGSAFGASCNLFFLDVTWLEFRDFKTEPGITGWRWISSPESPPPPPTSTLWDYDEPWFKNHTVPFQSEAQVLSVLVTHIWFVCFGTFQEKLESTVSFGLSLRLLCTR